MFEGVEEMESNGRACGKADNRSIDLPRIKVFAFSPEEPEGAEDVEELNERAEKRIGDDSSQNSYIKSNHFRHCLPLFLRPDS